MSSPMVSATKDSYFEPWYLLLSYNVPLPVKTQVTLEQVTLEQKFWSKMNTNKQLVTQLESLDPRFTQQKIELNQIEILHHICPWSKTIGPAYLAALHVSQNGSHRKQTFSTQFSDKKSLITLVFFEVTLEKQNLTGVSFHLHLVVALKLQPESQHEVQLLAILVQSPR